MGSMKASSEKPNTQAQQHNIMPVSLETLLMNGPIASPKQLAIIKSNRKAINRWRKS